MSPVLDIVDLALGLALPAFVSWNSGADEARLPIAGAGPAISEKGRSPVSPK